MHHKGRFPNVFFGANLRPDSAALAILIVLLFLIFVLLCMTLTAQPAQAQTFQVIHNFTGGIDGAAPFAGLTIDAAGNFYGTTCGSPCLGGVANAGTVFHLSKNGSGWVFTPLYIFRGGIDGAAPDARVIIGPNGSLYGTTNGGGSTGSGTIFNLKPATSVSPNISAGWTETVLYSFSGGNDGANPEAEVVFDQAGNLYGTTLYGGQGEGQHGFGVVFQLTPAGSGWTESVLHTFTGGSDGGWPVDSLIFDSAGNLYGTTAYGGTWGQYGCSFGWSCGTVFKLVQSSSGWTESVVYSLQGGTDGGNPLGGVIFGADGYLYGTTSWGGSSGGGTVFSINHPGLAPYPLSGSTNDYLPGSWASLTMDSVGNLYGTTYMDGTHHSGSVFQVSVSCGCGGCGWNYRLLHEFTGGSDGGNSLGGVVLDRNGNIFGTTYAGGAYGYGVVFEITSAEGSKTAPAGSSECSKGQ
jgi:uncharacterized repeat protein (TIGR03803 family)